MVVVPERRLSTSAERPEGVSCARGEAAKKSGGGVGLVVGLVVVVVERASPCSLSPVSLLSSALSCTVACSAPPLVSPSTADGPCIAVSSAGERWRIGSVGVLAVVDAAVEVGAAVVVDPGSKKACNGGIVAAFGYCSAMERTRTVSLLSLGRPKDTEAEAEAEAEERPTVRSLAPVAAATSETALSTASRR